MLNIPVLLDSYLLDSFKEKRLLAKEEKYKLSRFKGLKIGVMGFDKDSEARVLKDVEENQGIPVHGIDDIKSGVDFVLVNQDSWKKYESFAQTIGKVFVSEVWLYECRRRD